MTRLVLVHGRSQGERSSDEIREEWVSALERGLAKTAGLSLPPGTEVRAPFYGKRLDELATVTGTTLPHGPEDEKIDTFEAAILLQIARRAGVTDSDITEELGEEVPHGPQNTKWVLAAARLLSQRCPWLTEAALRKFTHDVHVYLIDSDVADEINRLVISEFSSGPTVVVGHSLGSVVAYNALTQQGAATDVPLFITLGSPLGIPAVKTRLPLPLGSPSGVSTWLNAADVKDPVALFPRLDRDNFPADIENLTDIHNPADNPHGISGYLSDRAIAKRIAGAL